MGEFLHVVKYQEAMMKIKENLPEGRLEKIDLQSAVKRVLAQDIKSNEDLPAFNRSTVDGYAVNAQDTFGCSESLPAYLDYVGEINMGEPAAVNLEKGQCCWIPTGGMLPANGDAAVMVEYTEKLGDDTILIYRPVGPGENTMLKGEDVKKGQQLLTKGKALRPQDIGFLASLGISQVDVCIPYNTGIISTGDEVIPIDKTPLPGQVRDVNTYSLAAALAVCGIKPRIYPLVTDSFTDLKKAVKKGLDENDILLLSGGSSVGVMDVTLDVLLDFEDSEILFHGIAVKPGKPTLAVRVGKKLVIGLPGHPVSALMMFYIVCAPFLRYAPGTQIRVEITQNIASQAGRDDFIPVKIETEGERIFARPILGKSGLMSILSLADAYIHISYEKQGILAGEKTTAYFF